MKTVVSTLRKTMVVFLVLVMGLTFLSVKPAQAATGTLIAWTNAYSLTGTSSTVTAAGTTFAIGVGANRVLVVGIATDMSSSGTASDPSKISYGGVTLTKAVGDGGTNGRMHTWLYYLKDNAVMDNTSRELDVTVTSSATPLRMDVFYAVYTGIDQTAAYVTGSGFSNIDGSGPAELSTAMTVGANGQAVYITSIYDNGSTTTPGYTVNANWTSGGSKTGSSASAWKNEVAYRAVPVSGTTDRAATSSITPASRIRYAMSAMVLPAVILVNTTTTVVCNPTAVNVHTGTSCTASVVRASGSNTPSGTVTFGTSGTGDFTSASCTLSGSSGTGSCSVTYTPSLVGTGSHTITASYGGDANFNTSSGNISETVNKLALTVSATGIDKTYDGNKNATVTLSDNRFAGDVFTDAYSAAAFLDKNVGTSKEVDVSGITISGVDAGNYTYNTTAKTTANINQMALTVSATGVDKTYDGTTDATVTLSDNRVSGDVFTDAYGAAAFLDKNVGTSKEVDVSGITISGVDAGNYTYNTTAKTTADINQMALTVSATGVDKTYDGTTDTTVTLSDDRVSGDVFTDNYSVAAFLDKNVGTSKEVDVSGITISGVDAGNYTYNTTAKTTADINQKALTVSATGVDKTYDGTTDATVTLSDDRVSGDVLTDAYGAAAFLDKNVGTSKEVDVSGITISGVDAGNYTYNTTAKTTADINQMALTVSATGVDKTYDGTTDATVTLSDNRVSGDVFTDAYGAAAFLDKNVGTSKEVNVSGITISGVDAGNYTYNTTAKTTADINQKALTVSATGVDKTYDGTTDATVTLFDDRVSGDVLTDAYGVAAFLDKNVGTSKEVDISGITISGADAGNYTYNTTAVTTADITVRTLTISAIGIDKLFDGTTDATVTLSDDRVSGDDLTVTYGSAAFSISTVGTGIPVDVTGITISSGADAGNYVLGNTTTLTTADITGFLLYLPNIIRGKV